MEKRNNGPHRGRREVEKKLYRGEKKSNRWGDFWIRTDDLITERGKEKPCTSKVSHRKKKQ